MIQGDKNDIRNNSEGYADPTAYQATKRIDEGIRDKRYEVKNYLRQYIHLTEQIEDLEHDLQKLRDTAESLAVNMDGMPRGTDISDRTGNGATALADLGQKIFAAKLRREEKRWEIMKTITKVKDPVLYKILRKRYIDLIVGDKGRKRLKGWVAVAAEMEYEDLRYLHRKHNQALDEVAKILTI